MTALAAPRQISQLDGPNWFQKVPVKGSTTVYHGAMVGKSGNYWAPATSAIAPLGIADLEAWDDQPKTGQASTQSNTWPNSIANTGADGARHMTVRRGVFKMGNKAGDLVDETLIGSLVYVGDDQTVQATSGGAAAGILIGFDDRDNLPLVAIGQTIVPFGQM